MILIELDLLNSLDKTKFYNVITLYVTSLHAIYM